MHSKQM